MSALGIDFGNESSVVAVAKGRGVEVLPNDLSDRETPAVVYFGEKQRFIGLYGAMNGPSHDPKNTISQIKRFIGRQFSDPDLQQDLKTLPFTVTEGPDGYPLIHAQYLGEARMFTPTQVLAMVFSDLKRIADKNLEIPEEEGTINLKKRYGDRCCIGIPAYFTELQRRAVLDAAKIAGLRPVCLLHETTATALAYGIYKKGLPENEQMNVAFVDVGHASMQVCIAGFKKGHLKILAYSFDRSLGGRDFDEVLFRHFAEKFKEEYKIDAYQNTRACLRLRTACENAKKALSEEQKAQLDVECLVNKVDVKGFIKREEFEKISVSILERVRKPLEKALSESGLAVENVHSVEVVGSASRVPAIIKILTEFFGKTPAHNMDACETVACGCTLQSAILNPYYKVRDFEVKESFPFHVAFSWKGSGPDIQNCAENQHSTVVFPKGNPIPSLRELTFHKSETFSIDVECTDVDGLHGPIGPIRKTRSPRTTLYVKVCLDVHGIVSVDSATLFEEAEAEVHLVKETKEIDIAEASRNAAKPDAKGKAWKKRVKKWNIMVSEIVYDALAPTDLQKLMEKELEMAVQDRLMEETSEEKNALEACIYDMRDKLDGMYQEFIPELERDELCVKLQEVEDWLRNEGSDETKAVYIAKCKELNKLGNPIEERYRAHIERTSESAS